MKRRGLLLILVVVCCLVSQPALGWGSRGHELVGQVAQNRLAKTSPEALKRALLLLRSTNARDGKCRPVEPERSFADVANDPDNFRQIELALVTRDWHFVNISITDPVYEQVRDCANGDCVVRRIERMIEILGDDKREACDRESALIYLIHFMGDLHQPFHTGFGRLDNGDPDLGGNRIKVILDGEEKNLHSVWDSGLIERTKRTNETWLARLNTNVLADRDPNPLAAGSVVDWTNESHRLRIDRHLKSQDPPLVLDDAYITTSTAIIEERLLLAGLRLARLIEEALVEK